MNHDFFNPMSPIEKTNVYQLGGGGERGRGGCCSAIDRAKLAVTEIIIKGWARRMFLKRKLMLRFDSNKSIVL